MEFVMRSVLLPFLVLPVCAAPAVASATPLPPGGVEEILITSRPFGQSRFDAVQGTAVLTGEELSRRLEGTLGETLAAIPGVSSSSFGPGASRPVIRGLGAGRVRVLSGGIGSIDASTTSPDHAVAIEPLTAQRIEVIRGPGTLLYGSAAVGGVVNVIDGRIPMSAPENGASGGLRGAYSSVDDGWQGQAELNAALGSFVLHIDGYKRDTRDLEIPGFAESDALRALEEAEHEHDDDHAGEDIRGLLPNSDVDNEGGAIGLSYLFDSGFIGVSLSRNDMNYGVPGGHGHGEGDQDAVGPDEADHGEEGVRIDLEQTRFDLMGEINRDFGVFKAAKLRFGYADYEHTELEGDEIGTVFQNEGWEGRIELVQQEAGNLRGAVGLQMLSRDFAAFGEEAFVPPTDTFLWGVFVVEEFGAGPWTFDAGARLERQSVEAQDLGVDRDFTGFSASLAAAYDLSDGWRVGVAGARSARLPTAEELFSNGPHAATSAFEIGDPNLAKEVGWTAEFSLKKRAGRVNGSFNLFYNRFDDFIYQAFTGAEEDGLTVLAYRQDDAEFWGGEIEIAYRAIDRKGLQATLSLGADMVRAKLVDTGEPLPRIPPKSLTAGIEVLSRYVDGTLELLLVDDQDRLAAFELPTDGFAFVNASLSVHPFPDTADLTFSVIARNIGDREGRNHVSFLKDRVPLPGRDIRLVALYRF